MSNTPEYNADYYARNRDSRKLQILERFRAIKTTVDAIKMERGCRICGYKKSPRALEFHHLRDKKYNISRMVAQGRSLIAIRAEIQKCEILCANCHAEHHEETQR